MIRTDQLERLRLQTRLFDAAEQAVVATDPAGGIIYWNRAAERLYGWPAGEAIGREANALLVPEEERGRAAEVMTRLRSGHSCSGEFVLRHRSGSSLRVTATNTPVYDDDGSLVGVVGISTDVTEIRRMEEALRESEERFRVLSQSAFEGIFIHDGERILEANQALSDISGYEREELVGKPGLGFVTAESAEVLQRHLASGSEEPVEVVGRKKDGGLVHLEVRGRDMTYRRSQALMVAVRDISRRKRAEADLAESEARYRALVEQVPVTTYTEVVSDSGSTQYISPQSKTLLGYTPREIEELSRSGPFWGLLHPDDRDRAIAEDDRTNQTGQEFAAEYRMVRKDGRVVWIEDRAILVSRDENGVQRWQGVMQDITARKEAERALRVSEQRFRSLVQNASDLITILGADGTISYESPAVEWVLGYEPEELVGKVAFDFVHPEDAEKVSGEYLEMLENPQYKPMVEFRFRCKDGTWCHLEAIGNNLLDDPTVNGVVVNSRDVTERKEAEEALREAEERYRTLVERLPAIVYVREAEGEGRPIYTSPQVEEILGYTPEECRLDRTPWLETLHPNDRDRVLAEDRVSNETGKPFSMEYRQVSKDGRLVWVRDEAVLVRDDRGRPRFWQGFTMDITERKVLEEQLKYQAFHDPLTGLPNRALFVDRLEHALAGIERRGVGLAVLFLDLDDFKSVNDGFGHDTGDRLLVAVAERLRTCLRPLDTLARFGGDEFAILLEDVKSPEDVAMVANRISDEMRDPFQVDGRKLFTAVSIGISLGDSPDALAEEMLRNADTAMYHAKALESTSYEVFEPRMYARILKRLELTSDLRRAVEQGEFRVHYQPQVQLETGRIAGMEALVRWEHPERGLIYPAEFVPLAEETGLIVPLGRWVLREACRQAGEWHSQYPAARDLRIGVNLSLNQFHNQSLVEEISGAVDEAGLGSHHLSLEITENIAMKNAEITAAALQKLKGLGVNLAIDDFGTGHSSLAYLIRKFKMDVLKVDRSFVSELDHDVEDGTIVAGIVGLAQNLNLQVVAEGVETAEQYARLRHIGCDLGQGFYFSRPLPGDQASRLLALDTRW